MPNQSPFSYPDESFEGPNGPFCGPDCDKCGEPQNLVVHDGEEYPYCPACGEDPDCEMASDCELCGENPSDYSHHTSYIFDMTIEICSSCHGEVHDSSEKYSEYEPVYARKVAIERGIFDPRG